MIMASKRNLVNICHEAALRFNNSTGRENKLIPCYGKIETNESGKVEYKKPPCKGFDVNKYLSNVDEIRKITSIEIIAIQLGMDYIAFDLDSKEAIASYEQFFGKDSCNAPTLKLWSVPGERACYLFLRSPQCKNLSKQRFGGIDIRYDAQYQAIGGWHPRGMLYENNGLDPAEIPESIILALERQQSQIYRNNKEETQQSHSGESSHVELMRLESMITMLQACDVESVSADCSYQDWLRISFICHEIDSGDGGFDLWNRFSRASFVTGEACIKYPGEDVLLKKWQSINPQNKNRKATIATIVQLFNSTFDIAPKEIKSEYSNLKNDIDIQYKSEIRTLDAAFAIIAELDTSSLDASLTSLLQPLTIEFKQRLFDLENQYHRYLELERIKRLQANPVAEVSAPGLDFSTLECIFSLIPSGEKIKTVLDNNNINYLIGITLLLTACASTIRKNRQGIFTGNKGEFRLNLFTILIGETSKGKSRAIKLFTKALNDLEMEAFQLDELRTQQFEVEDEIWKYRKPDERKAILENYRSYLKNKESQGLTSDVGNIEDPNEVLRPPKKPERSRHYIRREITSEGLRNYVASQKSHNILLQIEEFAGFLGSMTSYNGTKDPGMEKQKSTLINALDGDPIQTSQVGGEINGYWGLSIITGCQPTVFDGEINKDDPRGLVSRMIFLNATMLENKNTNPNEKKIEHRFDEELKTIYRSLSLLPDQDLQVDWPGFELWNAFDVACQARANHVGVGFRNWLNKFGFTTAKLITTLHNLECVQDPMKDLLVVSLETVERGLALAKLHVESHEKFFEGSEDEINGFDIETSKTHDYILRYLEKKLDGATVHQIGKNRHFTSQKMKTADVRAFCDELYILNKVQKVSGGIYKVK